MLCVCKKGHGCGVGFCGGEWFCLLLLRMVVACVCLVDNSVVESVTEVAGVAVVVVVVVVCCCSWCWWWWWCGAVVVVRCD